MRIPTAAFDGSVSLELSGGNRALSGNLVGDWGVLPDRLYLVGSYAGGTLAQMIGGPLLRRIFAGLLIVVALDLMRR